MMGGTARADRAQRMRARRDLSEGARQACGARGLLGALEYEPPGPAPGTNVHS